jgi:IclR family acetate operon transcriptional repressor
VVVLEARERVGGRVKNWSCGMPPPCDCGQAIAPQHTRMRALVKELGLHLYKPHPVATGEGRDVVYVDSVSGTRSVRLFTEIGRAIPAHTSGAGKALLAWREPADLEALLGDAPLPASTPRTLTTLEALREDFARIRRRGYALDDQEHEEGVSCVAAPVFDGTATAFAAISVSAPTTRIVHADTRRLGGLLRRHAAEVSAALGYDAASGARRAGAG